MNATISIVLPVKNRADIVVETLDSIAAQTERPLSLVIVDNASSDNTLDVVTQWASVHDTPDFAVTVVSEPTPGAAAARNRGLKEVTTPYVMFFDSDDTMSPSHVKDFADTFRNDPSIDIAGRDVLSIELDGSTRRYPFTDKDVLFRHLFNAVLSTQRYAAKTSLFLKAGSWNPDALAWNDYELGVRLLMLSPKIKRIDNQCTVTMHRLKDSITGTSFSATPEKWEHSLDLCEMTLTKNGLSALSIELRRIVLAALYRKEGSPQSERLLNEVMTHHNGFIERMALKFAFAYTCRGGRGIHHLLKMFKNIF